MRITKSAEHIAVCDAGLPFASLPTELKVEEGKIQILIIHLAFM
jgi:hypothetical protein